MCITINFGPGVPFNAVSYDGGGGNHRLGGTLVSDYKSCSGLNFQHKMKPLALIEDELEQWQ